MSNYVFDPKYSVLHGNIHHDLDPVNKHFQHVSINHGKKFFGDWSAQNHSRKFSILFKIAWALLFIPLFFWRDEITAIAFSMLR